MAVIRMTGGRVVKSGSHEFTGSEVKHTDANRRHGIRVTIRARQKGQKPLTIDVAAFRRVEIERLRSDLDLLMGHFGLTASTTSRMAIHLLADAVRTGRFDVAHKEA